MTAPEAYIKFAPELFPGDGEVTNESTKDFLRSYLAEFRHARHPGADRPTPRGNAVRRRIGPRRDRPGCWRTACLQPGTAVLPAGSWD
jgi:hypothetical protein